MTLRGNPKGIPTVKTQNPIISKLVTLGHNKNNTFKKADSAIRLKDFRRKVDLRGKSLSMFSQVEITLSRAGLVEITFNLAGTIGTTLRQLDYPRGLLTTVRQTGCRKE